VLEGEISEANYKMLKRELARVINPEEDSVLFYIFRTTKYSRRETMGVVKGGEDFMY